MKAELNMHPLCRCMMIIKLCRVCVTLLNVTSQSESAVFCPGKRPSLIFDEATTQSFGSAALFCSCQSPWLTGQTWVAWVLQEDRSLIDGALSCYMCRVIKYLDNSARPPSSVPSPLLEAPCEAVLDLRCSCFLASGPDTLFYEVKLREVICFRPCQNRTRCCYLGRSYYY